MSWADADAWAQQQFPGSYGIEKQRGFMPAMKAGFNQGMGAGLRGVGDWTGSTRLDDAGKAMMAPDQTPGAYTPTTGEDTDAAFKEGIVPGVSSFIDQHVTEPIGGMFGRYGVPMAVGAAAVPAAALAGAPVAAGSLGALALGGAGFMAADTPMEQGENKQRFEEVQAQRVEQGLAPQQYDALETTAWSLAQASLMPLLGAAGGKLATPFLKAMGPELATTAKMVQTGQLTKEAAIAQLNSHGRNYLVKTAEMGAIGVPLMVGTEAMRTAQSGEDWTGEPAMDRYGEAAKAAIVGAPVFGALGFHGVRRSHVKAIDQADAANTAMLADARKENAWKDGQATQMGLDLGTPEQPKGGFQGNITPGATDVITPEFFDQHGVPDKGKGRELRKRYEGVPLNDVESLSALYAELEPLANSKVPEAAAYARVAGTIEPAIKAAEQREPDQRNWIDEQYVENMKAGRARAAKVREAQANNQERIDYGNQKAAEQINQAQVETAALNARTQTRQEDMFNHALTRDDMSKPEPEVVASPRELADRKAEAYEEFQKAYEHYQKTGDDAALTEIVARAKEDLGPYDEHLNQQSTRALFDKNGRPTPGARNAKAEPAAPQGKDRVSDAVSVPREAPVEASGTKADAGGARPGVPADERPVVGKKPVNAPVRDDLAARREARGVAQLKADLAGGRDRTQAEEIMDTMEMNFNVDIPAEARAFLHKQLEGKPEAVANNIATKYMEQYVANREKPAQVAQRAKKEKTTSVATKVKREAPARAEAAKKTTLADQLVATDKQKADTKAAAEARDAEQYLPEATTTGIGRAGKATAVEEFAPAHFKLDSPEHMGKDGTPNHGMQALWWNDLAQMASDIKTGTKEEKLVARKAIAQGRKNKTITTEQLERAVAEDKKNIELLKKYKRKAIFERMAQVREEQASAMAGEKSRQKELRDAKKAIAEFERKEVERQAKEEQADRDAERHMVSKKEKPAELEATDIDEAGVVSLRDLDMPDPDAFMYASAAKPKNPHTAEGVRAEIEKDFTNTKAMDSFVKVYETQAEAKADHPSMTDKRVAGFRTAEGKVVLVAENIERGDVLGKVLHEVGVHEGMEKILGEKVMTQLQEKVAEWAGRNDGSLESRVANEAVKSSLKSKSANRQREAVAYMVEGLVREGVTPKDFTAAGKWLKQFKDGVRKFLTKLGLTKDITPQELVDVAYGAARMALEGKKLKEIGTEKAAKTPRYSDEIPAKARVTLEHEGPDGKVTTKEYRAKEVMREAEQRVNMLEALKRCLG
jgi:hypothetical protein